MFRSVQSLKSKFMYSRTAAAQNVADQHANEQTKHLPLTNHKNLHFGEVYRFFKSAVSLLLDKCTKVFNHSLQLGVKVKLNRKLSNPVSEKLNTQVQAYLYNH